MRTWRLPRTAGFSFAASLADSSLSASGLVVVLWLDQRFHAGPGLIGLLLALPTAAYVCSTVVMGHTADRVGRRRMALAGASIMAATTLALAFARSPWGMVLPMLLRGVGAAMFWPALSGWISRGVSPALLPRRLTAYNLGWSTGFIYGAFVGGLGYVYLGPRQAIAALALFPLIVAAIVLRLPELEQAEHPGRPAPPPSDASPKWDRSQAWLGNFVAFFTLSAVKSLFPLYGRQRMGLDEQQISVLFSFYAICQTGTFYYLGVLRPAHSSGALRPASQTMCGLALLALAVRMPLAAPLLMVCLGANCSISFMASMVHSVRGRVDTARQGGINEAIVGSGGLFGAWLGGQVAQWYGLAAPWWLAAAMLISTAAWDLLGRRRARPATLG